jgi:hypothetical protein
LQKFKVLIVAKTYPVLSTKYMELVCTGGLLEDGSFVRLYPIDYRYRPFWQWYKKYQWIEVEAEKNRSDPRPESLRPNCESIRPLGEPISTKHNWRYRREVVERARISTMCELNRIDQRECSLGIVRPREVHSLTVVPTEREWSPKFLARLQQLSLFESERKPLEKIPFKFQCDYLCHDPNCRGHSQMISDWEFGELYRKMRDRTNSESRASEIVKQKFLESICGDDVDTRFFVGTVLQYNSWIIVGTFYPKREQPTLQL